MKINFKWIFAIVGALILCGGGTLSVVAKDEIKSVAATVASNYAMTVNGKVWQPINKDNQRVYPLVVDGTSYLPVRLLSDALGVAIAWDNTTRTIVIGGNPNDHDADAPADPHPHMDSTDTAAAPGADLTKLPLGDGKYTLDGPKRGYIYVQSKPLKGGGATKDGDWIDKADGTFDMTKKAEVDGAVHWDSELTIELKGDKRILTGNRLPDHPTGKYPIDPSDDAYSYDHNPNAIKEQLFKLQLPASPVAAGKASPVTPGAIGVMLTGSLIFNGLDAAGRDAVAHETQDSCYGHPEKSGEYHYHNLSACMNDPYTGEHSKLVGYALDGFGIYGKYGEDGKLLTNDDLDEFHGHTHTIEWDGKMVNMYHYHATNEFPYSIGAFRGTPMRLVMNP